MCSLINTEKFSARLRQRAVVLRDRRILIARLHGSQEEKDGYTRLNCQGYGRIRQFRSYRIHMENRSPSAAPPRPLLRGHPPAELLRTQVFQLAVCNWRCWYCYVDDNLLSGNIKFARYFTAGELIDLYLQEPNPPDILDLSGGQPDVVPEWDLWMMEEIERRGLKGTLFLWADDNLSNRFLWRFLNAKEREYMASFPNYSRVGCFKGFDEDSFVFNTNAAPHLFWQQFDIFRDLLREGFTMYAYATFPVVPRPLTRVHDAVRRFVDRLQSVHPNLPLRTVPLNILPFSATRMHMHEAHRTAIEFQSVVYRFWLEELRTRFPGSLLALPFDEVSLQNA